MVRFYENLLGKDPTGKGKDLKKRDAARPALAEAKKWLRSLTRKEAGELAARFAGRQVARQHRRAAAGGQGRAEAEAARGRQAVRAPLLLGGVHADRRLRLRRFGERRVPDSHRPRSGVGRT